MQDDRGNAPKQIDLQKIFTPANDADEILPKNSRKFVYNKRKNNLKKSNPKMKKKILKSFCVPNFNF